MSNHRRRRLSDHDFGNGSIDFETAFIIASAKEVIQGKIGLMSEKNLEVSEIP